MALRPSVVQPSRVSTADPTGYPDGKARDVTTPGVGGTNDGTAWVGSFINEVFGFFQGLLSQAGITPDGTPEKANDSQLVDAVKALAKEETKYVYSTSAATSATLADANHNAFIQYTAGTAITLTMSAPASPYGRCITVQRKGAGDITVTGSVVNASVLSTANKLASLISTPGGWEMVV